MFKENEDNAERVDRLVSLLMSRKRGDVVTHEEIVAVTGLSPRGEGKSRYYGVCRRARRMFQDATGITTGPVTSVGFKLLEAGETLVEHQHDRFRRARRQFGRARKAAEVILESDLSPLQSRRREAVVEAASAAMAFARERAARAARAAATPEPTAYYDRPAHANERRTEGVA